MFKDHCTIPGLIYVKEYIDREEELELIRVIDQQSWSQELKRRVQHYGYKYNYKNKAIDSSAYLGPMPNWLIRLCYELLQKEIFSVLPNQVIINEYLPGQGIAPHIDSISCFGNTVCSLSLGSLCVMDFIKENRVSIPLDPRSLLILRDDARYRWKHGIVARKHDNYCSTKITRDRRISLTFREVE